MELERDFEATGLIKHISKLRKHPTGKLRVLDPMPLRGMEVLFVLNDVDIPENERTLLEAGVMLKFKIKGDNRNGFYAYEISPVECAEYNGFVIRVPTPSNPRCGTVVSLDLTLDPVVISKESLQRMNLREVLALRDYVRLAIRWTDWITALEANKKVEYDLVEVLERSKARPRALSQDRERRSVDQSSRVVRNREQVSSEELSPQHERSKSQRRTNTLGPRPRSRSVGHALPPGIDSAPPQSYLYMQPQRFPGGQYPALHPDMMHGTYNDFYNQSLMWAAANYMPPYGPRGAP